MLNRFLLVASCLILNHLYVFAQMASVDITKIKEEFRVKVEEESEGAMRLVSFEKTNTIPGFNEFHRELEYRGTVEVVKECYRYTKAQCHVLFNVYLSPACHYYPNASFEKLRVGTRYTFDGTTKIVASENGWLLDINKSKTSIDHLIAFGVNSSSCKCTGNDGAEIVQCKAGQIVTVNSSANSSTSNTAQSSSSNQQPPTAKTVEKLTKSFTGSHSSKFESAAIKLEYNTPIGEGGQKVVDQVLEQFAVRLKPSTGNVASGKADYTVIMGDQTFEFFSYKNSKTNAITYKLEIVFALTVTDANGKQIASENFRIGNGAWDRSFAAKQDALYSSLEKLSKPVRELVYKAFPVKTTISALYEPDRKSMNKKCRLASGSDHGILDGQTYAIYAGDRKIGLVKVVDPPTSNTSECKIQDGLEEINALHALGEKLTAVTEYR